MVFTTRSHGLFLLHELWWGGYRVVFVGDSFVDPSLPARLPAGFYAAVPFTSGVAAVQAPCADGTFLSNRFERGTATASHPYDTGFVTPISGATDQGVRSLDNTDLDFEAGLAWPLTTSQRWFGLTFGGATEEYLSGHRTPAGGNALFDHRCVLGSTEGLANPRFAAAGTAMKWRLLYRHASDAADQQQDVTLKDQTESGNTVAFNLRTQARKRWQDGDDPTLGVAGSPRAGDLNAPYLDVDWTASAGASNDLRVASASGTGDILSVAGSVWYDPARIGPSRLGTYLSTLGDASWSYEAHATAAASTSGTPKRYTDAQLANWLDITTVNRRQQLLVVLHLACEDLTQAALEGHVEAIRERWIAACGTVGLPPPRFLFFGPWNHHVDGALNAAAVEANNAAMLAVAQRNPDCCFFSLYAATDGVLLDGSASAQAWVSARGFSTFRYGSTTGDLSDGLLLDGSNLHPADQDAAAFMGHLFAQELRAHSVSPIIVVPPRRKLRYPSGMPV